MAPILPHPMMPSLSGDLGPHEAGFLPFAGLRRIIRRRDLPRQRQDHRDCVLGRRHGIAVGGVHHHDAARRRLGNVDIVDADTGPPDNLQVRRGVEDLARHLGRRADRQPVIPADDGGELGRLQPGLHIHLDPAGLEDFDGLRAELVTDKYFRHGSAPFAGRLLLCFVGVRPRPCGAARGRSHRPSRPREEAVRCPAGRPSDRPRSAAPSGRRDRR